jgi:hypothetical protein
MCDCVIDVQVDFCLYGTIESFCVMNGDLYHAQSVHGEKIVVTLTLI